MADTFLQKEIEVYSEKYDIHGVVRDYGVVTKLSFLYDGKNIEMAIDRNPLKGEKYEDVGRDVIESYVSKLAAPQTGRKLQLHYWYIREHEIDGVVKRIAHGIVTGHKKLPDSIDIHTSPVKSVFVDKDEEELVINTENSIYHCPLAYCRFREQDKYPDMIPDYEEIKEKYKGKLDYPSVEKGKVLLVLSNFCDYYFHSLYYVPADSEDEEPRHYTGWAHVGTFQDSYLISTEEGSIDLRYFPHYQNIEFYSEVTCGCPWYIENIGDSVLYASTSCGKIRLDPGERKEVSKANAETDPPILPGGDLYPAGVF